jgi:hypothetical protein
MSYFQVAAQKAQSNPSRFLSDHSDYMIHSGGMSDMCALTLVHWVLKPTRRLQSTRVLSADSLVQFRTAFLLPSIDTQP